MAPQMSKSDIATSDLTMFNVAVAQEIYQSFGPGPNKWFLFAYFELKQDFYFTDKWPLCHDWCANQTFQLIKYR
jgi:hypothetical protein